MGDVKPSKKRADWDARHLAAADSPARGAALLKVEAARVAAANLIIRAMIDAGIAKQNEKSLAISKEMLDELRPLVNVRGRTGEDKVCATFDYMLQSSHIFPQLHPEIVSIQKEYQLPCGRADRLLMHADGSFTVVEIKPGGSRCHQAHGLGQAIMYASSMRTTRRDNAEIRAALVVGADYDCEIADACKSVGVEYIPISRWEQDLIDDLADIHYNGSFSAL